MASAPLPRGWKTHIKSSLLHAISPAMVALTVARSRSGADALRTELEPATNEIALLVGESARDAERAGPDCISCRRSCSRAWFSASSEAAEIAGPIHGREFRRRNSLRVDARSRSPSLNGNG